MLAYGNKYFLLAIGFIDFLYRIIIYGQRHFLKKKARCVIFRSHAVSSPPKLTLYTKNPCSLCDVLKNELRTNFAGHYQLEEIDITAQGNERYFKLYRYDIPVLFLEGQYLCKHRLDADLLRSRLRDFSSEQDIY